MSEIVVIGAGPTGLIAALPLARRGHHITVCEQDADPAPDDIEEAWRSWQRPSVPQLRHSHLLFPRGRQILRDHLPDVFAGLFTSGCLDIDSSKQASAGTTDSNDRDLGWVAARRPVLECIIHRVAANEPGVVLRLHTSVMGLDYVPRRNGSPPVVTGVRTRHDGSIRADLVIDSRGRQAISTNWLEEITGRAPIVESFSCADIPYSRFFRWRPGCSLPPCPRPLGPVGDLGYAIYVVNLADNGTFSVVLAIPPGDTELKDLRRDAAFMAAARSIEPLVPIVSPDMSTPISSVAAMGGLQNWVRELNVEGTPAIVGYQPIGDGLLHTNPRYGFGISLGAEHALILADTLTDNSNDLYSWAVVVNEKLRLLNREWYQVAVTADEDLARQRRGDMSQVEPDSYPNLMRTFLYPAMKVDGEIFRAVQRRGGLLDPPMAIYNRPGLIDRARAIAAANPLPAAPTIGPDRARLLEIIATASDESVAAGAGD